MQTGGYQYMADIYDELMYDVNYDEWADYIGRLLEKHSGSGSSIFEAGCGTGSISVRLAGQGYKITASDVSPEMLNIACENARKSGANIKFILQDMRELTSTVKKDAVIACCDVVNYLTEDGDLERFFKAAYDILTPGGTLLFDISSYDKIKNTLGNELFFEDGDNVTYLWQNSFDDEFDCVKMDIIMFVRSADGKYARFDETHTQRAYKIEEICSALRKTGFKDISAYSFLTEDEAGDTDERIQFAASGKGI